VLVPADPEFSSADQQAALERQLEHERKGAVRRTWISGLLLPVTETIDFFNPVPMFAFEVNLAYFAVQLQGLRKATALKGDDVSLTLEPSTHLEPLRERLAALCNAAAQKKFPDVSKDGARHKGGAAVSHLGTTSQEGLATAGQASQAQPHHLQAPGINVTAPTPEGDQEDRHRDLHSPDTDDDAVWGGDEHGDGPAYGRAGGRELAEAVVTAFRASVPPEVAARHALDDLDFLAKDIERCLRKGVKEYLKTI
jgi:hypothetical protein